LTKRSFEVPTAARRVPAQRRKPQSAPLPIPPELVAMVEMRIVDLGELAGERTQTAF
jgi:hypothetical protein